MARVCGARTVAPRRSPAVLRPFSRRSDHGPGRPGGGNGRDVQPAQGADRSHGRAEDQFPRAGQRHRVVGAGENPENVRLDRGCHGRNLQQRRRRRNPLRILHRHDARLRSSSRVPMTSTDHSDEYADIRDAVAKLCGQFPGEYWRKLDRQMAYPKAFVDALTEAGYLSVLIPEEYGGAGLKLSAAAAILEEIQRAGCNGGGCHAQMYTMGTLLRHGSDEQKAKWLPKVASGELRLQAFGVSKPTSGTDTSSLKTFAKREGNDSYIVNGQKIWTSRAEYSDLMILLARTTPKEQARKRTDGLSVFIVDMKAAKDNGLSISPIRTMMNHSTTEVFFTDMKVPAENLIGEEGRGFRYILSGMNAERILIAAECIGDAKWFIAKATNYAKERAVFDRPIGRNQGVQFPIARAYAQMRAAELMVHEAATLYAAGKDCGPEANMAKMLAADASWAAADMCVQTHGGFGFAEEFEIERKFRETRLYSVAPISTNLVLSYLAEHVLGLPRSY